MALYTCRRLFTAALLGILCAGFFLYIASGPVAHWMPTDYAALDQSPEEMAASLLYDREQQGSNKERRMTVVETRGNGFSSASREKSAVVAEIQPSNKSAKAMQSSSVWERRDREWSVLRNVIDTMLGRGSGSSSSQQSTSASAADSQNISAFRQAYVYPLLRKYLALYSNWSPPNPLEVRKRLCLGDFCLKPQDEKLHLLCLQHSLEYSVNNELLTRHKTEEDILKRMTCTCKQFGPDTKMPRKRVALSSLAGSGNTWVRQMLESATGICTGSMWCDASLRANHFCGEGQVSESLLVVKDHSPSIVWRGSLESLSRHNRRPEYDAMILICRNPFDAIVSEWNRKLFSKQFDSAHGHNQHVASYGPEMFGNALLHTLKYTGV